MDVIISSGVLTEGLMYGIMALGVFITFRVLDFPDLTVDGSFPFGACIMAASILAGVNPWIALIFAFAGGVLAGFITAAIHNYLKVPNLLSGILTMTMLYSINLRVLGNRANVALLKTDNLQSSLVSSFADFGIPSMYAVFIIFLLAAFVVKILLDVFFRTDLGITLGALGNNAQMVVSTGANPAHLKFLGLGLSNGLVAVAGAMASQYQGFADVNLGQGIIVAGLASVMIGEFVLKSNRIFILTLRVLLGSIFFRGLMYAARYYGYDIGLQPNDHRLLTGLLIIILLIFTQARKENKSFMQSLRSFLKLEKSEKQDGKNA